MVVKKQKLKIAIIGSSKYKEIDDERKNMAYNSGRAIAESGLWDFPYVRTDTKPTRS